MLSSLGNNNEENVDKNVDSLDLEWRFVSKFRTKSKVSLLYYFFIYFLPPIKRREKWWWIGRRLKLIIGRSVLNTEGGYEVDRATSKRGGEHAKTIAELPSWELNNLSPFSEFNNDSSFDSLKLFLSEGTRFRIFPRKVSGRIGFFFFCASSLEFEFAWHLRANEDNHSNHYLNDLDAVHLERG